MNNILTIIFSITIVIMGRYLIELRKQAVAVQNTEHSQISLTRLEMPLSLAPSGRPYASIVRWRVECLVEDPVTSTELWSMSGFSEELGDSSNDSYCREPGLHPSWPASSARSSGESASRSNVSCDLSTPNALDCHGAHLQA